MVNTHVEIPKSGFSFFDVLRRFFIVRIEVRSSTQGGYLSDPDFQLGHEGAAAVQKKQILVLLDPLVVTCAVQPGGGCDLFPPMLCMYVASETPIYSTRLVEHETR